MATTVNRPLAWPLVADELIKRGERPIFIGEDGNFRFQARDDDDVAIDLTGYVIELHVTVGTVTVVRSTANEIGSTGEDENEIDANQTTEVGDTGKGWYQTNWSHDAADVAIWETVEGIGEYKILLIDPDVGDVIRHFAGPIEIGS
jgi:hypothetical protein